MTTRITVWEPLALARLQETFPDIVFTADECDDTEYSFAFAWHDDAARQRLMAILTTCGAAWCVSGV